MTLLLKTNENIIVITVVCIYLEAEVKYTYRLQGDKKMRFEVNGNACSYHYALKARVPWCLLLLHKCLL